MNLFFIFFTALFINDGNLKPVNTFNLLRGECSGISCYDNMCIISNDDGSVVSLDLNTKKVVPLGIYGEDFEGVAVEKNIFYLVEERSRKLLTYSIDSLKLIKTLTINYNGRLNRGFEGVTFDQDNIFVITEKNPCMIFVIDKKNHTVSNEIILEINEASDISFYKNHFWILSEQDHCIYVYTKDFKLFRKYNLNLIGAEGICFHKNQMLISSDKLSKIYFYNIPKLK